MPLERRSDEPSLYRHIARRADDQQLAWEKMLGETIICRNSVYDLS